MSEHAADKPLDQWTARDLRILMAAQEALLLELYAEVMNITIPEGPHVGANIAIDRVRARLENAVTRAKTNRGVPDFPEGQISHVEGFRHALLERLRREPF